MLNNEKHVCFISRRCVYVLKAKVRMYVYSLDQRNWMLSVNIYGHFKDEVRLFPNFGFYNLKFVVIHLCYVSYYFSFDKKDALISFCWSGIYFTYLCQYLFLFLVCLFYREKYCSNWLNELERNIVVNNVSKFCLIQFGNSSLYTIDVHMYVPYTFSIFRCPNYL